MQSLALRSGTALDLLQERTWGSLWFCSINYMNSLLQLLGSSCLAPAAWLQRQLTLPSQTYLALIRSWLSLQINHCRIVITDPLPYCHDGRGAPSGSAGRCRGSAGAADRLRAPGCWEVSHFQHLPFIPQSRVVCDTPKASRVWTISMSNVTTHSF